MKKELIFKGGAPLFSAKQRIITSTIEGSRTAGKIDFSVDFFWTVTSKKYSKKSAVFWDPAQRQSRILLEAEEYRICYHSSSLERFDLKKSLISWKDSLSF
jgi:hypothetical protein